MSATIHDLPRCFVRFKDSTYSKTVPHLVKCEDALQLMKEKSERVSDVLIVVNPDLTKKTLKYERFQAEYEGLDPIVFSEYLKCAITGNNYREYDVCKKTLFARALSASHVRDA